ncbi:cytochrome c [Primorskyibacter aestuariivivens]|uniref:c-type cytochrome n=1 Tax=Primorskyibacter aestuariivivens TaxID=1888912 RepID=UPI0023009057|nr:cytochrome c [Primorskyibacter aestuariivivens]MDA7426974.1 cytochrome c [Primorskyibacter aestuariivivens]
MKKFVSALVIAATMTGGAAFAQDYKNQLKARQGSMWVVALNMGVLGGMAKGEMEYDADKAMAAAHSLHGVSMIHFASLFPEGSDGAMIEGTTAKDTINSDMAGFQEKWDAFGAAAERAVAEVGNGQEALGPVMGALGGTCKACHQDYRIPQE